jgi:ATP-dependent Clp protease protease subunit
MKKQKKAEEEYHPMFRDLSDEICFSSLRRGVLYVSGDITQGSATGFTRSMYYLLDHQMKDILVVVGSPGGYVYPGLEIYNTIRDAVGQGVNVVTEARGLCASMAVIILCAGKERLGYTTSRFLLHELASGEIGKISEMEESVKELRRMDDLLQGIIADTTGHSKAELNKLVKKNEKWMSAEEALKFKLITKIIDRKRK